MRQSTNPTANKVIQLLGDICRMAGLKVTRQRSEVLTELAHADYAPTVDGIHRRLCARMPAFSRETVRRTLEALERSGIVQQTGADDPPPVRAGNPAYGRRSPRRRNSSRAGRSGKRRA